MSRLHHPNIVALHGLVIPPSVLGDTPALVAEYVPGGTLFDALHLPGANQLLPWRSRVSIALQVARAMQYMHGQGIVHLDLKPSNLYLDMRDPARPVCKIGDFNAAMVQKFNRTVSTQRVIGTPGYQAPELMEGDQEGYWPRRVTKKADVYSFGVVMWELLTGKTPDQLVEEKMPTVLLVSNREEEELHTIYNLVPSWWCYPRWRRLMEDCLTGDAAKRPAFSEVAEKLGEMLAEFIEPAPWPASRKFPRGKECNFAAAYKKGCPPPFDGSGKTRLLPLQRANSL